MRKTLLALVAGAMILGGAAIAVAQTDDTTDGTATHPVTVRDRGEHLSEFLADMVDEGVISQEQADTLAAELQDRLELRRSEREQVRAQMRERREALEEAFSDDVLTVTELEELGAQRILDEDGRFAGALADGELTRAEFDEIHETLPRRFPGGQRHAGFGRGNA